MEAPDTCPPLSAGHQVTVILVVSAMLPTKATPTQWKKENPWNQHCTVFFIACKANGLHPVKYLQRTPRNEKKAPQGTLNSRFEIPPVSNMCNCHSSSINKFHEMCRSQWENTCDGIKGEFDWQNKDGAHVTMAIIVGAALKRLVSMICCVMNSGFCSGLNHLEKTSNVFLEH